MSYADRASKKPPRTLTIAEQRRLLDVSGRYKDGFRDHVIFSLTLACALREEEVVGLNVGDVADERGTTPKRTIELRTYKRARGVDEKAQYVRLSDAAYYKLKKYLEQRFRTWRPMPTEPLFVSRKKNRLSTRQVRELMHNWQRRAGFDKLHNFHILRHTAISNAYRDSKSIRVAQRIARHADISTTTRYEHASDEDVERIAKRLIS